MRFGPCVGLAAHSCHQADQRGRLAGGRGGGWTFRLGCSPLEAYLILAGPCSGLPVVSWPLQRSRARGFLPTSYTHPPRALLYALTPGSGNALASSVGLPVRGCSSPLERPRQQPARFCCEGVHSSALAEFEPGGPCNTRTGGASLRLAPVLEWVTFGPHSRLSSSEVVDSTALVSTILGIGRTGKLSPGRVRVRARTL